MTARNGGALMLPAIIGVLDVPVAETPSMHVRNALMLIRFIEQLSPATWVLNPELGRASRRAEAALILIEHHGPVRCALQHLRSAILALTDADLDWDVITEIPHACIRLLSALFLLECSA